MYNSQNDQQYCKDDLAVSGLQYAVQSSPQEHVLQNNNNSLCSKVELRRHFQVTFRALGCSADRVWQRIKRSRLVESLRINVGLWKLFWTQSFDAETPKVVTVISRDSPKSWAAICWFAENLTKQEILSLQEEECLPRDSTLDCRD